MYSLNTPSVENYFKDATSKGNIYEKMSDDQRQELSIPDGPFTLTLQLDPFSTGDIQIAIHDKQSLPNFRGISLNVAQAHQYNLKLRASYYEALTPGLNRWTRKQEIVYFANENEDLKFFRKYSKNACMFECALKEIERVCRCTPWDFPRNVSNNRIQPCYGENQVCASKVLETRPSCHCPMDCQSVKYLAETVKLEWFAASDRNCYDITPGNTSDMNVLASTWNAMEAVMKKINLDDLSMFQSYDAADYCYRRAGMKLVISYEDSSAEKITKFGRVSFVGMLSNLGN